jgi:uncharacterized protein
MIRQITILTLFLCSFLIVCGQNSKESYWENLPNSKGWVNDFENIFTVEQEKALDSLISEYEKRTTIEITVISIPTSATDKDHFDELTLLIANKWGVGKKEKDNGILIGISKGHRTIRIQNGYGIEKLITDLQTKQIIDQIIIPNFKADDFYQGVFDGIQEIKKTLDKGSKSDYINLNEVSVYQFIELLKVDMKNTTQLNILTIGLQTPENWITENDIDSLMTFINSTEPAKCVTQVINSHLPIGDSSTIGGQVMDIIEAFINKKTYPTVLTSCAKTDSERIEQIKKWWDKQKK